MVKGSHSYKLSELANLRSGDKGNTANIGVYISVVVCVCVSVVVSQCMHVHVTCLCVMQGF